MNVNEREFSRRVSKSLEDALGQRVMEVVSSIMKKDYGIRKDDLARNPAALQNVLSKLFGPTGLDFLEKLISKEIEREFDIRDNLMERGSTLTLILQRAHQKVIS
jgi:hypothetical protein